MIALASFCLGNTGNQNHQPMAEANKVTEEVTKEVKEIKNLDFNSTLVKRGPGQATFQIYAKESTPDVPSLADVSFDSETYTIVAFPDSDREGYKRVALVELYSFKPDELKYVYYLPLELFQQLSEYFDIRHIRK